MVPPDSHRISRARCYLGNTSGRCSVFVYGALTLYGDPFQRPSTNTTFSHSPSTRQSQLDGPTTPTTQRLPAITCDRFSLIRFRSPLLTESRLFSLPVGTEMFHFPTFPPHALCVQARVTPHDWCGVPPFGNPRINARLTAPRGLSQPPTSFIGSWCPGIHRVPLTTWPHKNPTHHPRKEPIVRAYKNSAKQSQKMLASTVQFSTYDQPPITRPHQPSTSLRRHSGMRCRPALTQEQRPRPGACAPAGSALSGPNSVPTNQTPRPDSGPRTTPRGMQYWEPATRAGRTGQRSTLEHHPRSSAPIRNWMAVVSWARLWTTHTRWAASAP